MAETRDASHAQNGPDVAPLSWVIDEIRTALHAATQGLREFQATKLKNESLRAARDQVHQATGALQLLDLRGVALLTDAVEQLLRSWESKPTDCQPTAVKTVETALAAVIAYLEGLLAGRPNQPLRLFPYYRDVQQLNNAARAHPADLMFPDLSRRPAFHNIEVRPLSTDQLRVKRAHFESALLAFLRDPKNANARLQMRDALGDLEQLPQRGLARSFWWVVRGLLEALQGDELPVDVDLKRVLARLNLQLRRLIEGGGAVAERLMVDALFYVGRSADKHPRVAEAKRLYGLDALIPSNYEQPTLTAVDRDALRALRESLEYIKTQWSQYVAGTVKDVDPLATEIEHAEGAARRIGGDAIAQVLKTMAQTTANFSALSGDLREALALEVASALLFVDSGLDELPHDTEYAERARAVCERLRAVHEARPLPESTPWVTELARKAQDRITMTTVAQESQATLREIEQRLDKFFREPGVREELPATDPMFEQLAGVLAMLGFDDAVAALRNVQATVRGFADGSGTADEATFGRVAQNLGALGFFVESLAQDGDRPRGTFRYDSLTQTFTAELGGGQHDDIALPDDDPIVVPKAVDTPAEVKRPENVEAAVEQHREAMLQAAGQLAVDPSNGRVLQELNRTAALLVTEADLIDDAALKQKATRAVQLLTRSGAADRALAAELHALFAPPPAVQAPPPAPLPSSQDAADQELHQIFVEEANEVLDSIDTQAEQLARLRDDQATLTTVRRAFHTLKGSSRMVGMKTFGDAAWSIEQCLNLFLAQERPANDDLLSLIDAGRAQLRVWMGVLARQPRAQLDTTALVTAAQGVRDGQPFVMDQVAAPAAPAVTAPAPTAAPVVAALLVAAATPARAVDVPPVPAAKPDLSIAIPPNEVGPTHDEDEFGPVTQVPMGIEADGEDLGLPSFLPPAAPTEPVPDAAVQPRAEDLKRIGPVEISHGLYTVFLNEADECIRALAQDFAEWRHESGRAVSEVAVRRAHSFAGITSTVGLGPVLAIADPLDDLMHELSRQAFHAPLQFAPAQFDILERGLERMRGMLHQFAADIFPSEAPLEAAAMHELLAFTRAASAIHLADTPDSAGVVVPATAVDRAPVPVASLPAPAPAPAR